MELSEKERKSLYLSISVIALTIIAIAAFIMYGSGYIFYIIAVITIILGFYMSRYISKEEVYKPNKAKSKKSK
jgi:4-hydroxybenzoate polyprenyltransferase